MPELPNLARVPRPHAGCRSTAVTEIGSPALKAKVWWMVLDPAGTGVGAKSEKASQRTPELWAIAGTEMDQGPRVRQAQSSLWGHLFISTSQ